jgi:hypothetical protein
MVRLNGLSLRDNDNGTFTIMSECGDLFTGNYNHCIYVINHMGTSTNCDITYIITDEQVDAFKDINHDVQKQVEQYIIDNYPHINQAHCKYCCNIGDAVMSLYRFAEQRHYNIFKLAFDATPYTSAQALEQLSKNIDKHFIQKGVDALKPDLDIWGEVTC